VLESVAIENFRCIQQARVDFDSRATVICGDNGSGKTSLLEALFFVGSGRSFRTNVREQLVARGADLLRVVARCSQAGSQISLGAEWSAGEPRFRLGGRSIRSAVEMAEVLPLQVIDPGVHRIIEEGSARRRRLLDWGVFHVKHEFMPAWRRYHRALEQRNAALRSGAAMQAVAIWDPELISAGTLVDQARCSYIAAFQSHFSVLARRLLPEEVSVSYHSGWSREASLSEALQSAQPSDARVRFTTVGPHRADLRIRYAGQVARERVSRGEQKMLAVTLILAQISCLSALADRQTCLLLDDPAAELDVDNLGKLLDCIEYLPGQLIVTAVHREALADFTFGRVFHVKQGRFEPVL
jgi:DNA replication and repair protein RecF